MILIHKSGNVEIYKFKGGKIGAVVFNYADATYTVSIREGANLIVRQRRLTKSLALYFLKQYA